MFITASVNMYVCRRCMLLGRIVEDEGEFHIAFRDKV